jgi:hypothetical protein
MNFPTISADTIASIGDPWVAEAHKRRVQDVMQGPGDYRSKAMALMSIDPASAAQLIKLSGQEQTAGHQSEELRLRREALDKPSAHFDEGSQRWFEYRPRGPDGGIGVRWLTEQPPTTSTTNRPPPQPSTFDGSGTPSSGAIPPVPGNPQQGAGGALPDLPDGVTRDDIGRLAARPAIDRQRWETMFKVPPGTADRLIQAYTGRSSADGADGQFPGGVQRVAGSETDLPDEVQQSFAQAAPAPAYNQRRIPPTPAPPQAGGTYPAPQQPAPPQDYPLNPADARKYNLDMAKHQGEADLKDRKAKQDAASEALDHLETANKMETYARQANQAGLANNFMQFGPIASGMSMARGVFDVLNRGTGKEAPGMIGATKWQDLYEQQRSRMELQASSAFKGQGAVSDNERKILQRGLPQLGLMNTPEGMAQIAEYRRVLYKVIRQGGYGVPGVD